MLDEEEGSVGLQHAPDLGERLVLIRDRAEDERRNDGVERCVLERQRFRARLHGTERSAGFLAAPSRTLQQCTAGLRQNELRDGVRVVPDVEPRSGTDLEHAAACVAQQLPAFRRELLVRVRAEELGDRRSQASAHDPMVSHPRSGQTCRGAA